VRTTLQIEDSLLSELRHTRRRRCIASRGLTLIRLLKLPERGARVSENAKSAGTRRIYSSTRIIASLRERDQRLPIIRRETRRIGRIDPRARDVYKNNSNTTFDYRTSISLESHSDSRSIAQMDYVGGLTDCASTRVPFYSARIAMRRRLVAGILNSEDSNRVPRFVSLSLSLAQRESS